MQFQLTWLGEDCPGLCRTAKRAENRAEAHPDASVTAVREGPETSYLRLLAPIIPLPSVLQRTRTEVEDTPTIRKALCGIVA